MGEAMEVVGGRDYCDAAAGGFGEVFEITGDKPGSGGVCQCEERRVGWVGHRVRPAERIRVLLASLHKCFEPGWRKAEARKLISAKYHTVFPKHIGAGNNPYPATERPALNQPIRDAILLDSGGDNHVRIKDDGWHQALFFNSCARISARAA